MSWSSLLIAYLIVGIVVAECGMKAMVREKKPYGVGPYIISVALWPIVVTMAGGYLFVEKLLGR